MCISSPKKRWEFPDVDFIIRGEAEESFSDLAEAHWLEAVISKRSPDWGTKARERFHLNPSPPLIQDLDRLPMPARHLIQQDRYNSVLATSSPITTMMTSRGCPMRCVYCDRPHLGKRFRYRSAESVVEEMAVCRQSGIGEIFIYDDTFTIKKDRVLEGLPGDQRTPARYPLGYPRSY